jgi:hypothetical protein
MLIEKILCIITQKFFKNNKNVIYIPKNFIYLQIATPKADKKKILQQESKKFVRVKSIQ